MYFFVHYFVQRCIVIVISWFLYRRKVQKYLIGLFHVMEVKNIGYGFVLMEVYFPTAT